MELSSNIINTLKCFNGSNDKKINDKLFETIIENVFQSFLINSKNGNFEINLEKNNIGNLFSFN